MLEETIISTTTAAMHVISIERARQVEAAAGALQGPERAHRRVFEQPEQPEQPEVAVRRAPVLCHLSLSFIFFPGPLVRWFAALIALTISRYSDRSSLRPPATRSCCFPECPE